ncbi:hypothetical protein Syun_000903 [Stephania yunnanensis]|uniref:Uncharacterized protein n=1 Tax=Stephania yunnanensis TaxID=152371 RepID=A0AAP0LCS9_9MAGN
MEVDSIPLDEEEEGAAENCCRNVDLVESCLKSLTESDREACVICKLGGDLLRSCDGKACKRSFHFDCIDLPSVDVSPGDWHCMWCVKKKIKSGVHSVSKGVESIWDVRETDVCNCEGKQREYFVKYQGLAHIHNRWVHEDQLLIEAPSLLVKFKQSQKVVKWKSEWIMPHRLLKKRLLISLKQRDEYLGDRDHDELDCQYEWLVKWSGLGYEFATWELENASFFRSPEGSILMKQYEDRLVMAKRASKTSTADKGLLQERECNFSKLLELPGRVSSRLNNDHLSTVNKLRECWHKSQNAVFIEDQERILRVIFSILSLNSNMCRPLLIISATAISTWETEFACLAPSINVVVYDANKDVRDCIRKLEFYGEDGCIMFQVLLATPEVVVEDMEVFECIRWEIIIIDEGQNSSMSNHLEQIKKLTTDVRFLLVTGPIKDSVPEYLNLLSFIDFGCDERSSGNLKMNSGDDINWLKERFTQLTASERKSDSFKFVEYWVPVQLSNVQLELYCSTLLSSSTLLRSCSRNDPVGALRDILISLRKCCDHPYLADQSVLSILMKGLPDPETKLLDVGIRASGKLKVLDKVLSEVRKRGLRVLIIFQSIKGSAQNSLGDILEDFLGYRFGKDSYERVDSGLVYSKKQVALSRFNDKEKGRFVFLIENRACSASIKLSSVDFIILFDSDWNPLNDLKALQKISIESQFEELKVFRLYSAFAVEERVLVLAKNDVNTLESNLQNIHPTISQMLLCWGAYYLFSRLDGFHATSSSVPDVAIEESFSDDVVQEFLNQLPNAGCMDMTNCSMISKVQQCGSRYYGDVSLPGESKGLSKNEESPQFFWTSLLAEKSPQWRFLSGPCPRVRRKTHYLDHSPKKSKIEDGVVVKRKMVATNSIDPVSLKSVAKDKQRAVSHEEAANVSDTVEAQGVGYDEKRNSRDLQKDLHLSLEPEILKLCDILQLEGSFKDMARRFLDYILNNYRVATDPPPILQAFKISVCLSAASLLKQKISLRESLALAKQHLDFECKEEEARYIHHKLRVLKKMFSDQEKVTELDFVDCPVARTEGGGEKNLLVNTSHSKLSDQQELEEGEIRESPKSHNSFGQNASSKQEQSFDSEKVSVSTKIDLSASIKKVKRIHGKRMRILASKQMEEFDQFNKHREEKLEKAKVTLEKTRKVESAFIRTIISQASIRSDKLRMVDTEFSRKLQEVHNGIDAEQKMLEAKQLASRNVERQLMAHWLEEAKSGRSVDAFSTIPLSHSDFRMGQLEVGGKHHADTQEVSGGISCPLRIQDPDGNVPSKAASAEAPSYLSSEVVEATGFAELEPATGESGRENDDVDMTTTMSPMNANIIIVHKCSQVGTSDSQIPPMVPTQLDSPGQLDVTAAPEGEVLSLQMAQNPDDNGISKAPLPEVPSDIVGTAVGTEVQTFARDSGGENEEMDVTMASEDANVVAMQKRSHEDILVGGLISTSLEQDSVESLGQKNVTASASDSEVPSLQIVKNLESSISVGLNTKDTPIPETQESQHPNQPVEGLPELADAGQSSSLVSSSGPEMRQPSPEIPSSELGQTEMNACTAIENSQSNGANTLSQQLEVSRRSAESQSLQYNDSNLHPDMVSVAGNLRRENSSTQCSPPTQASAEAQNGPVNPSVAPLQQYLPLNSGIQPLLRAPVAPRMYQPLQDPFQHEMARLRKDIDQATKMREEVKTRLNSECEKEIEEIRKKYNSMIQDAEKALLEKQNELEVIYQKVDMNHKLAEAFRLKNSEPKYFSSSGLQHLGSTQGLLRPVQFSPRQQVQRAAAAPPVQVVHNSAALFSTNPMRPQVNPVIPPVRNQQHPTEIRAAPPHLRPFRPSSSMSMGNCPPFPSLMRPPQPFSNSATTSAFPTLPVPAPPHAQSSAIPSRIPQSEPVGGPPVFHHSPQSALDPLPDIGNLPGGNPSPNILPSSQGLNFNTWDMAEPAIAGALRSSAAQVNSSAGDVVCVSDDD